MYVGTIIMLCLLLSLYWKHMKSQNLTSEATCESALRILAQGCLHAVGVMGVISVKIQYGVHISRSVLCYSLSEIGVDNYAF